MLYNANIQENTTNRDRFAKLTQYGLKVVAHLLQLQKDAIKSTNKQKIEYFDALLKTTAGVEYDVAMARKVFAFFKWINGYIACFEFYAKIKRIHASRSKLRTMKTTEKITFIEILGVLSKFLLAHVNMLDNLNFLAKVGVLYNVKQIENKQGLSKLLVRLFNNERAADYGRKGCWLWLFGIITNVTVDSINMAYALKNQILVSSELEKLQVGQLCQCECHFGKDASELRAELDKTIEQRNKLLWSYAKNICDLGISTTGVNITEFSKGTVGFLGCVNTAIGLYETWK
jgi:hypothetical protein